MKQSTSIKDLNNKINKLFESFQKNETKNVFLEEDDKIYDQGQTLKGVNWKAFIIDEKDVNFVDMNLHYLKLKQVYDHPEYRDKIFWILDKSDRTLTILSNKISDMIRGLLNEPDISVLSWGHLIIPSKMEVK